MSGLSAADGILRGFYADAVRQQLEESIPWLGADPVGDGNAAAAHDFTVAELAEALAALPAEVQGYEVWIEADPSMPVGMVPAWIDHESRRVFL